MRQPLFIALLSLSLNACGGDLTPSEERLGAHEDGVLTLQTATFDATYKAPRCSGEGPNCDSGSLLHGRSDSVPEANRPNTLDASCADGTWGGYFVNRAIERLTVSTTDGSPLAAGKTVKLEATVYAYSLVQDKLDLYSTASVENPSWTYIGTYTPSSSGLTTLSATYTLPAGGVQAVRANFRFVDSTNTHSPASICSSGNYDDHDDLIFAVQPPTALH
jgi:leucyl aminopeptidase